MLSKFCMGGEIMKKLLAGLLVLTMFIIPIQVNSFSEGYSIMINIQEQLALVREYSQSLLLILTVPDTLYQADGIVVELSTDQKKDLFDLGVTEWLKLKDAYDSLKVLVQAFKKDSIF